MEKNKTIDSKVYSEVLLHVDVAFWYEFRCKKEMFQQDNARPHVSVFTDWILYKLKWDLLPHPPYSFDIIPSDNYLFSYLQLHLTNAIFNSAQDVQNEGDLFLDSQPPSFWVKDIEQLPNRWHKIHRFWWILHNPH